MTMFPDDQPPTHPFDPPAPGYRCTHCDGPLRGRRLRCPDCLAAAYRAIERAGGGTVRPSMIDRERNAGVRITYDARARAAFVYVSDVPIRETREITETVLIDLDDDGNVVGVELLGVDMPTVEDITIADAAR